MAEKMTQAQRMGLARAEAMEVFGVEARELNQVGVGEYALETANGYVKVKFTAVKDLEYDAGQAEAEFLFEQEQKEVARKAKAEEKARKAELRAKEKAKNAKVEKAE